MVDTSTKNKDSAKSAQMGTYQQEKGYKELHDASSGVNLLFNIAELVGSSPRITCLCSFPGIILQDTIGTHQKKEPRLDQ